MKKIILLVLVLQLTAFSALSAIQNKNTWDYPLFIFDRYEINGSQDFYQFESDLRKDNDVVDEFNNQSETGIISYLLFEDNKIVICDRFTDSTRMYQGMRGPNLRNLVDMLNEKIINCDPDLTIVIDIDPQISLKRAKSRETVEERFEDFGVEMQLNMRKGFIELAKEFSNRIEVVNGQQSVDDLSKDICSIVKAKLS